MRRIFTALTTLAVLAAPSAFAADAMMKKEVPAMMEKTPDAMMSKPDAMMAKPTLSAYVQARLDALAKRIVAGSKKEANIAWIKSSMAKVAPGSHAAAVYAYLLEKIENGGQDAMMKQEAPAMMDKPDAMMKPADGSGAMMTK